MTDTAVEVRGSDRSSATAALVADWVRPDEGRLSNRIYVEPDVYALEVERIWKKMWLWAGHETEVPEPGDYVTRTVGTVPIVITRGTDGQVHVLLNQCAHRGNLVCSYERGSSSVFKCAYHGWSYRNDGTNVGIPYQSAYGDEFSKGEWGLNTAARLSIYRGFIFISHAADGPTLEEHLGNAREPLDRFIDLSPTGELRFDAGYHRVKLACNWKMYVENASDNYHANFVHISAFSTPEQRKISAAISRDGSKAVIRAMDNGHTDLDFRAEQERQGMVLRTGNASSTDNAAQKEYDKALEARLGAETAKTIVAGGPPTLFIHPNMFIIQQDVRRVEPLSAQRSHLYQHPALLEGAADSINEQRLARHEAAYGPAGFVLSDDLEIFGRNQRVMESYPDDWVKISRGQHREEVDEKGATFSHATDETGIRGMWRHYRQRMTAE
jgi:phenylpropionate dioxygenase-like ring-hydroxylating dioxygenase large terminal subunit